MFSSVYLLSIDKCILIHASYLIFVHELAMPFPSMSNLLSTGIEYEACVQDYTVPATEICLTMPASHCRVSIGLHITYTRLVFAMPPTAHCMGTSLGIFLVVLSKLGYIM